MLDNKSARLAISRVVDPLARALIRLNISADTITVLGALGTSAAGIFAISQGHFVVGTILVLALSLSDLLDGTMARMSGTSGPWGAFLDSTLDRVTDYSLISSLAFYFAFTKHDSSLAALFLGSAGLSLITSYIRSRAESLGATCTVGLIERAERMGIVHLVLIAACFGAFAIITFLTYALFVGSLVTVTQRILYVRQQLKQES